MLAEMRIQTALLLSQLIQEQEQREERLKEMVVSILFPFVAMVSSAGYLKKKLK